MSLEHVIDSPLAHAIRAAKSQSAFGRAIGRSQPYVHGLLRDGKALPAEEAIRAESIDGVSRYALRPDIFGAAPAASGTGIAR